MNAHTLTQKTIYGYIKYTLYTKTYSANGPVIIIFKRETIKATETCFSTAGEIRHCGY